MLKRKKIREKGKIRFSRYFQELKEGDKVSIVQDLGVRKGRNFPKTIQGRTGTVKGKRGTCCVVDIKIGKDKRFVIHPAHLKKLR